MAAGPGGLEGGGAEARRAELLAWCRAQTDDLCEALAWAERLEAFITGGLGSACGPSGAAYGPSPDRPSSADLPPPAVPGSSAEGFAPQAGFAKAGGYGPQGDFGPPRDLRSPAGAVTPQAPDEPPQEVTGSAEQAGKDAAALARSAREGGADSIGQRPDERGSGEIAVEATTGAAGGAREAQDKNAIEGQDKFRGSGYQDKSNEGGRAAGSEPRRRVQVLALIERAAEEGWRCPSNAEIARAVGVGTQAASAAVQRLAQAGDIRVEDSGPTGRVVFVPRLGKRTAPLSSKAGALNRTRAVAGAKERDRASAAAGATAHPAPAEKDSASGSPAPAIGRGIRGAISETFSPAQREAVLAAVESLTALGGERVEALSPGLWRVEGRRATAEDLVKRANHQRHLAGLEPIAWPRRGALGRVP